MERIFYKKPTAIIFIAAILILVVLICVLLTTLVQMSALKERVDKLNELIAEAREQGRITDELREYLKSDDYVRKWAEDHGRINDDDIQWLNSNAS